MASALCLTGCREKDVLLEQPDDSVQVVKSNIVSEDSMEDYTETGSVLEDPGMTELTDNTVVDETGSYSEKELQQILTDVRAVLQEYISVIFTIDTKTEDYSSKLAGYYGNSDAFSTADTEKTAKIYETLHKDKTICTPETFVIKSLTMNPDTDLPSARVVAVLQASFQNAEVSSQECYIACAFDLLQEDGHWKLLATELPSVYSASDPFQVGYRKGTSGKVIDMVGKKLYTYEF